ncbi:hypothetical protein [Aureitalea marina]|uniref:Lysylphosphatidylglycerol synthetase n=1 Tax=Aureitalea marina TaxID=930804 RepID=A0A2S7KLH0_9FLAO|nr:hypothetical protein [Aureitalea marina]PQB03467.1 hypothetical protein BST85_00085 [Aureitalea marina]
MNALPYKSKQYGLIAIKLCLLGLSLFYIIGRMDQDMTLGHGFLLLSMPIFSLLLIMATLNWTLEAIKWKLAVSPVRPMKLVEAYKQTLAGLALSLATPARIGDFGVKAAYFSPSQRRSVLLSNGIAHGTQFLATLFFGLLGLLLSWNLIHPFLATANFWLATGIILLAAALIWLVWKKGARISIKRKIALRSSLSVLGLSLMRYVCFSLMFTVLMQIQSIELGWTQTLSLIWLTYLLSSAVPSFLILDVAIKGGVAVWLFSLAGIAAWPVLSAISLMWLFNMILPALIGAWFSLSYRPSHR